MDAQGVPETGGILVNGILFRIDGPAIVGQTELPADGAWFNLDVSFEDEGSCATFVGSAVFGPGPCENVCPNDVNGNGAVDVADVLLVLSDFGCSSDWCAATDIDGDGGITVSDVLALLSAFRAKLLSPGFTRPSALRRVPPSNSNLTLNCSISGSAGKTCRFKAPDTLPGVVIWASMTSPIHGCAVGGRAQHEPAAPRVCRNFQCRFSIDGEKIVPRLTGILNHGRVFRAMHATQIWRSCAGRWWRTCRLACQASASKNLGFMPELDQLPL